MTLPVLPHTADARTNAERTNVLIRKHNRPDLFVPSYAVDTGSATAYVITPSSDVRVYEVGQIFLFKATNANSGTAPTLNVQGIGAGTITKLGSAPLAIGDIAANSFNAVVVSSTTPTFELISSVAAGPASNSGATVYLGSDIALNNASNFFNGPNTGSIGASGWIVAIIAVSQIAATAGANTAEVAIFDGSAYHSNSVATSASALAPMTTTVVGVFTLSAATTFTLRAKCNQTTGALQTTGFATGVANQATSITYIRLA